MKKDLIIFNKELVNQKVHDEISECNNYTKDYGLKLSKADIIELLNTRELALEKSGRIEFDGQIIDKIIKKFCDSPYISQYNYGESINELVEIFYNYKNETMDLIGDDELIDIMKMYFDGYCQGSIELLEGKVLYKIAENLRNGVKDYSNLEDEKDL